MQEFAGCVQRVDERTGGLQIREVARAGDPERWSCASRRCVVGGRDVHIHERDRPLAILEAVLVRRVSLIDWNGISRYLV